MTTLGGAEHKVELAEDYLSAVSALMKADTCVKSQSLAVMFLFAHALELLLKAYVELKAPVKTRKSIATTSASCRGVPLVLDCWLKT